MAKDKFARKCSFQRESVLWMVVIVYRVGKTEFTHTETGTKAECQSDYRQFRSHCGSILTAYYENTRGEREVIV